MRQVRKARLSDAEMVLAVIKEVATEIPLCLEGSARLADMRQFIARCCQEGTSLVSVDKNGIVVGFLLMQRVLGWVI
jgi:hypothetical protein